MEDRIIEVLFKGTPIEFRDTVYILDNRLRNQYNQRIIYPLYDGSMMAIYGAHPTPTRDSHEGKTFIRFEFTPLSNKKRPIGRILAQRIPKGTLLRVYIPAGQAAVLEPTWNLVKEELERLEWVESDALTKQDTPRGRPRYKANDWAYEQVHMHGNKPTDIYNEWEDRLRSEMPPEQFDMLADPKDSFTKAIRQRKKRKK